MATFQTFYYMFTRLSSCRGKVNDVISDTEDTQGLIWVHMMANMGSHEWADMGLKS